MATGLGKTIVGGCVCVHVCVDRWVCTLLSGTLGEGTGGFKAFNLEKDRPRSLSPAPDGQMAEQGRMGPERGTNFHQAVSKLQTASNGRENPIRRAIPA